MIVAPELVVDCALVCLFNLHSSAPRRKNELFSMGFKVVTSGVELKLESTGSFHNAAS